MEFSRLKLALTNLLPRDATEFFKYQVLVDHLRLEEACLIANSYINSPRPYSDTIAGLNEKFGQPHHVVLKRIAVVMDSPEIRRGDTAAFERFALHVQSLVGMLKTLGPDVEVELRCGSHVARLLTKLPPELRASFRRHMFHRPGSTHTLLDLAEWLKYELWCQGYDIPSNTRPQGSLGHKVERRHSRSAATVLHGTESSAENSYRKSAFCGTVNNMTWPCSLQDDHHTWKDLVEAVLCELHGAAGQDNPVTASDYQQAEMVIYQRIQNDYFPEELHHLKEGKPVRKSSRLLTLSPELDPKESGDKPQV
ncbi:guanine nucleotide-binding subunit alpha-12 isoform X2 [Labeo rohita]|uniref:Guanine nucleotide-binding subunit alpha-12 isoform X2 n=1 Tax=Labeo rohita TaxID=84645 RepID=A0A498NLE8_LABRO|nr:guanine nucleotide-binding subunit alpha-12 isoform X2 [Labeo rohita]